MQWDMEWVNPIRLNLSSPTWHAMNAILPHNSADFGRQFKGGNNVCINDDIKISVLVLANGFALTHSMSQGNANYFFALCPALIL